MGYVLQVLRNHRRPVVTGSYDLSCSMVLKLIFKNSATMARIDKSFVVLEWFKAFL